MMSYGKMTTPITIIKTTQIKDAEGFAKSVDTVVVRVRAYKEERHGTEIWANRAAFSKASCLFRFRVIHGVTVTTSHTILCGDERYNIVSAEDVRGRGMYIEVLASKIEPTKR